MIPTTALPRRLPVVLAAAALALPACSSDGAGDVDAAGKEPAAAESDAAVSTDEDDGTGGDGSGESDDPGGSGPAGDSGLDAVGTLASDVVHELSFEFDEDDYAEMIETYTSTGGKEWIEATVTIDGVVYEQAGIRLKGNSSLRGIAGGGRAGGPAGGPGGDASADDPSSLPWLVKLDKYVDGQSLDGLTDLVVRSNNSETALNEAVALDLLEAAGLASQDAIAVAFSVNGSDEVLRLVIEHPDDVWMAEWFDDDGALYKAESTGDYSYRGDDPDAYDDVFDQEAGKDNADLTPLIEFLEWLNESDDATFADELAERLDVDAFATYLAMQELIGNFDDIDGPGNNSYLYYDTDTGLFTVVPWDHNLAFGALAGGGGFPRGGFPGGAPDGASSDVTVGDLPAPTGDRPARPVPADGGAPVAPTGGFPGGGFPGGGPGGSNVLVERFLGVDEWQAIYEQRLEELRAELYGSGLADEFLAGWAAVVTSSGLVDESTITTESDAIATFFE